MLNFIKSLVVFIIFTLYHKNLDVNCEKVRVVELTNIWTIKNQNGSIELVAKLPSGVYTALSAKYGDILQSQNDASLLWIAQENWTYTRSFNVNQADFEHVRAVNLTLHGVDTVATVRLNGVIIGMTDNMFVRYSFDVLPYLKLENVLEIEIMSPILAAKAQADALAAKNITAPPNCPHDMNQGICHRNMLRKMQSSFGGDWTLAAPSLGLWKMVTLEYYDVAIMRDIDVAVRKNDLNWTMDIRVFLNTGTQQDFYGQLTFFAADLLDAPVVVNRSQISYMSPVVEFKVDIPKEKVQQWWPNGYGAQKLYPLFFSMNCWLEADGPKLRAKSVSQKALKIGFRTLELVEKVDEYGRTFFFKVNGRAIFIKGANYLPSHVLPEQSADQDRIRHILQSAKEAHMNMIRVWGGGLYESDYFYSMADYYGLLVWQDMAFTGATYPITEEFVESVRLETAQNAKRLAYHPSLALLVTNDEIELYLIKNKTDFGHESDRLQEEYKQLFMGTIKHELNAIKRNDFNPRPGPMMSTPSLGIEESTKELGRDPQNPNYGDVHFWEDEKDGWNTDIYPRARFISEYGFQSLPIMASWNRSLGATDTVASLIRHRQRDPKGFWPVFQLIARHFPFLPQDWENNVEAFIYFSQVAQAMATKTATELFRSERANNRTMGALFWTLNDNWVAPSWSSIDFNGNYKLLYYWAKDFFAPITIIALPDLANRAINLTLMRDDITDFRDARVFNVSMNTYLWSDLYPKKKITWQVILDSNSLQPKVLPLDTIIVDSFTVNNCFLEFVMSEQDKVHAKTFYFPGTVSQAVGMLDPQLTVDISGRYCNEDARIVSYSLTVNIKHPALFVYIELFHPSVTTYKLSVNGFVQVNPVKVVQLEVQYKTQCPTITMEHIKVLTVNQFISGNSVVTTGVKASTGTVAMASVDPSTK